MLLPLLKINKHQFIERYNAREVIVQLIYIWIIKLKKNIAQCAFALQVELQAHVQQEKLKIDS